MNTDEIPDKELQQLIYDHIQELVDLTSKKGYDLKERGPMFMAHASGHYFSTMAINIAAIYTDLKSKVGEEMIEAAFDNIRQAAIDAWRNDKAFHKSAAASKETARILAKVIGEGPEETWCDDCGEVH